MRRRPLHALRAALLLLAAAGAAAAQQASGAKTFEGVWRIAEPRTALAAKESVIPFTAAGRKEYQANKAAAAKGDYSFDLTMSRCSSPGAPRIMLTDRPFKLFVRNEAVYLMFQWNRLLRPVKLGGTPVDNVWGTNMGDAWGHWEGDALVVESRNFMRDRLLDNLTPNSEDLRLVERIRLIDQDTLEDRITISDPEMFTRPWEAVVTYKRQPAQTFPEDVCLDRKAAGEAPWPGRAPTRSPAKQ